MQEHRCVKCSKLLFKGMLLDPRDTVELPCKCGKMNPFTGPQDQENQYEPAGAGGYALTKPVPAT